jgi:ribosomal protein L21E
MKYKIGDTVRIKNNLARYNMAPNRLKYEGQKTKIIATNFNNNLFKLAIDNGRREWPTVLLEPISKNKIFHSGNFININ